MDVVMMGVDEIKPYEHNPRRNDGAVAAVAKSIESYGFRVPIIVDGEGTIVAGHTRLCAAKQLGLQRVPVHRADDLTPEQARAFRIADNKLHELSSWNEELLASELEALRLLDVDLESLGFGDDEIDRLFGTDGGGVTEDDAPEPLPTAVARLGELWHLGDHRLLCGDSTSAEDVDRLMEGVKAALCATDPPYLVDYTGERVGESGKDWSATYKEIEIKDADGFFSSLFANVKRVLAPHAAIYCWHAHKRQPDIAMVWRRLGILDHQQIVWVKPSSVFGSVFWHFRHEPCMMGWVQGSKPPHDGSHEFSSVWEVNWEGKSKVVGNEHPTQKPLELFARPMRKHTRRGDIVFEPFSGSGSQLVAAEQLGRRCFAIELEPVFVDVAIRRWQTLTGSDAVLDGDGRTWSEIASERGVQTGAEAGAS